MDTRPLTPPPPLGRGTMVVWEAVTHCALSQFSLQTVGVPDPDILGTTEWYDFSPTTGIQGDAITLTFSGLLFSNIRGCCSAHVLHIALCAPSHGALCSFFCAEGDLRYPHQGFLSVDKEQLVVVVTEDSEAVSRAQAD